MRKISPPGLPIPPPATSIRTRIMGLSEHDVTVLEAVGDHLGSLASLDIAERIRLGDAHDKHDWADRKRRLTPECSSRWAGSITKASNEAYALARRNQWRTLGDTRRAIRAIEKKAHKPTRDVLGVERRKAGYADRGERHHKLRRAEKLRARHIRIASEIESGTVHLVRGGKKILKSRLHLQEAGLSEGEWRERWEAARTFFSADGESGKPLGNESVRVYPNGVVEVRLPSPLKHLSNMRGCRYRLDGTTEFSYRADKWLARVSADRAVAYRVWYALDKGRWYVDAAFTLPAELTPVVPDYEDAVKDGAIGVDLNAGHLSLWRLDASSNPVGTPKDIPLDMDGYSTCTRDGHLRAAQKRSGMPESVASRLLWWKTSASTRPAR